MVGMDDGAGVVGVGRVEDSSGCEGREQLEGER